MRNAAIFSIALLFLCANLFALPPENHQFNQDIAEKSLDYQSYTDANSLLMFATNTGGLAEDWSAMFGRANGMYFPFNGYCGGFEEKSVLYSAGLSLGGRVNGDIRVAVGAYDTPEYVAGPIDQNGDPMPDNPRFKMYKITNDSSNWIYPPAECNRLDSTLHFGDYALWQTPEVIADGAPLNESGLPLLKGKQTLWTVFNDAGEHSYTSYGGGTDPLGIEVQELIWADGIYGVDSVDNAIYIQYLFINKGGNTIEDFYVSFWADPDLGGSSDDLVGCDSANDIFYCYNATNNDNIYGATPPAVGGRILFGLVEPSPGDVAYFNGETRPGYRNLPMTSFNCYFNGIDPDTPEQLFGYMQGYNSVSDCPTCPYIDPNSNLETKYPLSGNPLMSDGWLDVNPSDRRLMANCGGIDFLPGDTQQVLFKIAVGQGNNRLESISYLFEILGVDASIPNYVPVTEIETYIDDSEGLKDVYLEGGPKWLAGVNWGGDYFYQGVDFAYNFFGSSLNPGIHSDQFVKTELRFTDNDPSAGQRAYRYCRSCDDNYGYLDYAQIPFQAWDVEHDYQLNVCFVEWFDSDVYDGTWGPDTSLTGGREYFAIMNSEYDGDNPSDAGTGSIDYTSLNYNDDSYWFDAMYSGWCKINGWHTLDEMDVGQKLVFDWRNKYNYDPYASNIEFGEVEVGGSTFQNLRITATSSGLSGVALSLSDEVNYSIDSEAFEFINTGIETIKITYHPQSSGEHNAQLTIVDGNYYSWLATMDLNGNANSSDEEAEIEVLPNPIYMIQKYPFGDPLNVEIFVPDLAVEYSVFDVNPVTVTINGIEPVGAVIGSSGYPNYQLHISVDITEFLDSYPLIWGNTEQTFVIAGQLNDESDFSTTGLVTIIGHTPGDVNLDNRVNIMDVTFLLAYMYMNGAAPLEPRIADVNGDEMSNILDATYMINYLYIGGPPPVIPED